jgi:ABC-2 type transport system permease protein
MKTFHKTGRLLLFNLRREAFYIIAWILGLTAFSVIIVYGMGHMFDDAARQALVITLNNPGIISMMGPVYGADHYTVGAMYANTMFIWVAMGVAVMNIFLVVQLTRSDEENGRTELVAASPAGRSSFPAAALATAIFTNLVLGLLHGIGLGVLNQDAMGMEACMLYGFSLAALGLVFAAVTAVFCQICANARSAVLFSFSFLGIVYLLRGMGDIGEETLSLISPLGLMQRARVFTENRWTPLFVLLAEAVVFMLLAFYLNTIRDIGQGFLHERPGRAHASALLRSPSGLAWRLSRNTIITWLIVIFMFAASYGTVLADIETFIAKSTFYQAIIGTSDEYSIPMLFVAMVNSIMTLLSTIPVITVALFLKKEEDSGRVDTVFSRPVARTAGFMSYIRLSFVLSILLQTSIALGLFASASAVMTDKIETAFFFKSALVYLPAVWFMEGLAVLIAGAIPKLSQLAYVYLAFSFLIIFIGRVLDLPEALKKLSPFYYIPRLPEEAIKPLPLVVLSILACGMMIAGLVLYRRRDLAS